MKLTGHISTGTLAQTDTYVMSENGCMTCRPTDGPTAVQMGTGMSKVEGMGEVILPLLNPKTGMVSKKSLKLKNVLYVPGFNINLLAHKRFDGSGCHHKGSDGRMYMYSNCNELMFWAESKGSNQLYLIGAAPPKPAAVNMKHEEPTKLVNSNAAVSSNVMSRNEALLYHHRLAHLSEKAVRKTLTEGHVNLAGAVPQLGEMEGMCEGCIKGRQV